MVSSSLLSILSLALVVRAGALASDSNSTLAKGEATLGSTFAGDTSIDVSVILNQAKNAKSHVLATFPSRSGRPNDVTIHGDWENLPGVSAFHFVADMDVDCDGSDTTCANDNSQQFQTSFGALDAAKVPFYILPARFSQSHKELKPNALGAIICANKLFYGIFGDENGDSPQVIGEASVLLAKTCFPTTKIDGNSGHDANDVTYIVFPSQVPSGVGKNTIDMVALKKLGDAQMRKLVTALSGRKESASAVIELATSSSAHDATSTQHASHATSTTASTQHASHATSTTALTQHASHAQQSSTAHHSTHSSVAAHSTVSAEQEVATEHGHHDEVSTENEHHNHHHGHHGKSTKRRHMHKRRNTEW